MNKLCVIIPVHKSSLTSDEKKSLLACAEKLSRYDCFLLFPEGMNTGDYLFVHAGLKLQPVAASWLGSLEGYNRLKRSLFFYQLFSKYQYLLTYELDAYIFSDDWEKAHCFQYDYIGAPWFENYGRDGNYKLAGVGNSGFSMRNVQACIRILTARERVKKRWYLFNKIKLDKIIPFALLMILGGEKEWKRTAKNYYFIPFTTDEHVSEDIFWGSVVPKILPFKIAGFEDSIRFSFEVNSEILYQMNKEQLPLGCHAWQKYNPQFWAPFIA